MSLDSLGNLPDNLLTEAEKRRLFHLDSPKVACWRYWGVLRTDRPLLGKTLLSQIGQFRESSDYPWLKCRKLGRGRIWLKVPQFILISPRRLGGPVEGEVFVGIEDDDPETWREAVKLYRRLRRTFVAKGRGGRPGEIAWKIVAQQLRENPDEFPYYLWLFASRKLRRWAERYGPAEHDGRDRDLVEKTERDLALKLAYAEMRRALGRVGLKLSELKADIFKREDYES